MGVFFTYQLVIGGFRKHQEYLPTKLMKLIPDAPCTWQFFVTFLGWLSDPFEWLSDLQLGDERVTKNHLVWNILPYTPDKLWQFSVKLPYYGNVRQALAVGGWMG